MLNDCPKGMRMRQLGKALMKQQGVNLEAFSCARGHKDVVSFLLLEVPGIRLWYPEKGEKCLVFSNAFKKSELDPIPGGTTSSPHPLSRARVLMLPVSSSTSACQNSAVCLGAC